MIAQMVWERALGIPITRPKSVTTDCPQFMGLNAYNILFLSKICGFYNQSSKDIYQSVRLLNPHNQTIVGVWESLDHVRGKKDIH